MEPEPRGWVSGRDATGGLSDFAGPEVAARLGWTPRTGARRLHEATRLAACLPATFAALCAGRIGRDRAQPCPASCPGCSSTLDPADPATPPDHTRTTVRRAGDGTIYWRLPAGHLYVQHPRPVLARPRARPVPAPGGAGLPPLPPEQPSSWDAAAPGYRHLLAAIRATEHATQQPDDTENTTDTDDVPPPF